MERQLRTVNPARQKRSAVCNTCTIQLVRLAYKRAPWFRLVREPLRLGLRAMAAWHRIDTSDYEVRTGGCYGCLRFYKTALKERSATFCWLNARVNPVFDTLLERIISPTEMREAEAYARAAMVSSDTTTGSTIQE